MFRAREGAVTNDRAPDATPGVRVSAESVRDVVRQPGEPLRPEQRLSLEQRFDWDFGRVRVHADRAAAMSARALHADAYTVGEHVVFGSGNYRPSTDAGLRLLAHELAHTIQQGGTTDMSVPLAANQPGDRWESEAHLAAERALDDPSGVRPTLSSAPIGIQRDGEPVFVEIEEVTPEKAEELDRLGIDLPEGRADARKHRDYIDARLQAVGYSLMAGGFMLYVDGLELPLFVAEKYVDFVSSSDAAFNDAIYPSYDAAAAGIPVGPPQAGSPWPLYTHYRTHGNVVVPTLFTPKSAPNTVQTMIAARKELAETVQAEMMALALAMMGGFVIKGLISVVARAPGIRPRDRGSLQGQKAAGPHEAAARERPDQRGRWIRRRPRLREQSAAVHQERRRTSTELRRSESRARKIRGDRRLLPGGLGPGDRVLSLDELDGGLVREPLRAPTRSWPRTAS